MSSKYTEVTKPGGEGESQGENLGFEGKGVEEGKGIGKVQV